MVAGPAERYTLFDEAHLTARSRAAMGRAAAPLPGSPTTRSYRSSGRPHKPAPSSRTLLRLPYGVKDLFEPGSTLLHRIRELRGGNLTTSTFGVHGTWVWAETLAAMFHMARN